MRAIIMVAALVFAWLYFYPTTPPVHPPPADSTEDSASYGQAESDPFSENAPSPSAQLPSGQQIPSESASLPPIPVDPDPVSDSVSISDDLMVLTFTKIGARLKEAELRLGDNGKNSIQVVPEWPELLDTEAEYPLELDFSDEGIRDALNFRRFVAAVDADGRSVTFTLDVPDKFTLRKIFSLTGNPHVVHMEVEYTNDSSQMRVLGWDETPAYLFNWAPNLVTDEDSFQPMTRLIWRTEIDGLVQNEFIQPVDMSPGATPILRTEWAGYKTKYFMVAMKPEGEERALADAWFEGNDERFQFGLATPRFEVAPGQSRRDGFDLYIGPMELASLDAAWPTLSSALTFFTMTGFGWLDTFAKMLLNLMHWFHDHTIANWGIAIILMTVLVRMVMLPLTLKSTRSMKKIQALAPEVEALREKYKDDQQELSRKTMEMYRERGANPMGGCFPMLIQMPVFIALYRMLWNTYEMRGQPFLWVEDLSRPDRLFHMPFMANVPLVGQYLDYFNILPLLMGAAMVLNMKVMPQPGVQNPQQKMIMNVMPIMFSIFCYPLASSLNLYVLTSTILGMAQQALVRGVTHEVTAESIKKKPAKKKRGNFYDNAMAKKKEMEKEAKRVKKQQSASKKESGNGDTKGRKNVKVKNKQSAKHGKKRSKS